MFLSLCAWILSLNFIGWSSTSTRFSIASFSSFPYLHSSSSLPLLALFRRLRLSLPPSLSSSPAGNVVFSEIMMLPNGMSKGCGFVTLPFTLTTLSKLTLDRCYQFCSVVEFSQPEEAQKAIRDLSDQQLLGRPVFIREVCVQISPLQFSYSLD